MMLFEYIYVSVFACIGALIGFFAIRDTPDLKRRNFELIKSVSTGVFTAIIVYTILTEELGRSHLLSMTLSGGFAFGGTDVGIKLYHKLVGKISEK